MRVLYGTIGFDGRVFGVSTLWYFIFIEKKNQKPFNPIKTSTLDELTRIHIAHIKLKLNVLNTVVALLQLSNERNAF